MSDELASGVLGRRIGLLLITAICAILLSACSNGFKANTSGSGLSGSSNNGNGPTGSGQCLQRKPAAVQSTTFSFSKIELASSSIKITSKGNLSKMTSFLPGWPGAAQVKVKKDIDLVAMLDSECVLNDSSGKFSAGLMTSGKEFPGRLSTHVFQLENDMDLAQLQRLTREDDCLIGLSENLPVELFLQPNDEHLQYMQHIRNMNGYEAWDLFLNSALGVTTDVVIGIIDTGVNYTHPDLVNSMWTNAAGNHGRDLVNNDDDPMDDHSHGTHVAGLSSAEINNTIGVTGVMGSRLKVMAVKSMDADGAGNLNNIVDGIVWATDNGADVINMSLGGAGQSAVIDTAVDYARNRNVMVVVAAGNETQEVNDNNLFFPANNGNKMGVLSVAATDAQNSQLADFSNFGPDYVEIAAPGADTANPNNGLLAPYYMDNMYLFSPGTSMASPIVAGAAGLVFGMLRSRGITPTPTMIETIITSSARTEPGLLNRVKDAKHLDLKTLADALTGRLPALIARQPRSQDKVLGESLELSVELSVTANLSFQWRKNGQDITGATDKVLSIASLGPGDSGTYQVVVSGGGQEFISEVAEIRIFDRYCP